MIKDTGDKKVFIIMEKIGDKITRARKIAGISLQELSNRIGNEVSKQSLNKYEKGLMKPSNDMIIKIANAININIDFFFKEQKDKIQFKNVRWYGK
jgi:transcriptional regulator with XRE-family HTH domain